MDDFENKWLPIVGYTWGISVVGAVICGILECCSIRTSYVGVIFGIIAFIPFPLLIVYGICSYILEKLFPNWPKEEVKNSTISIIIFLIAAWLFSVFF